MHLSRPYLKKKKTKKVAYFSIRRHADAGRFMGMFDLQITRNFSAQILTRIIHVWFAIIFGNFFPPKSLIL